MTQWIKSGRDDSFEVATTSWPPADAASTVLLAFLADPLDRHHLLVLGGVEHDHALGRAAGDADAFDAGADELAAVGHQHQLILVLDRERGDHAAGIAGHRHGDNAFAAAPGGAVLVGRAALAEPALGDREHELLGLRHFHIALLAELDRAARLLDVAYRLAGLRRLGGDAAPHRARALEIGGALVG